MTIDTSLAQADTMWVAACFFERLPRLVLPSVADAVVDADADAVVEKVVEAAVVTEAAVVEDAVAG